MIQFADGDRIKRVLAGSGPFREGYWDVIRKVEGRLLKAALDEANGNKAEAARILGIQRRLLYEKVSELGI